MPGAAKHEGRQRYAIWQLASRDQCWPRWLNEMSTPNAHRRVGDRLVWWRVYFGKPNLVVAWGKREIGIG
jgi:hypothetical protein